MNKRHYEHTLPNIRGSLSNTYVQIHLMISFRHGITRIYFIFFREIRVIPCLKRNKQIVSEFQFPFFSNALASSHNLSISSSVMSCRFLPSLMLCAST